MGTEGKPTMGCVESRKLAMDAEKLADENKRLKQEKADRLREENKELRDQHKELKKEMEEKMEKHKSDQWFGSGDRAARNHYRNHDSEERLARIEAKLVHGTQQENVVLREQHMDLKQEAAGSTTQWFGSGDRVEREHHLAQIEAQLGQNRAERAGYLHKQGMLISGPVRGESQAKNMEVDPLANIILDPEEQAKVDKINMDNLKYLNQDEHKADREIIAKLFAEIGSPCDKEHLKQKFPKQADHLFNEFDVDHDGTITEAEFCCVVDKKYAEKPEAAAKFIKFLSSKIRAK